MGNLPTWTPERADRPRTAPAQFGAVLARTAMTAAGLARLLRRHGWRISDRTVRAWAAAEQPRRPPSVPPPPPELLAWLQALAAHLDRDPLPPTRTDRTPAASERPPEVLLDWLRRLVRYHQRNPPPAPGGAWREDAATARRGRRHPVH
jgi:hypothetical protein